MSTLILRLVAATGEHAAGGAATDPEVRYAARTLELIRSNAALAGS